MKVGLLLLVIAAWLPLAMPYVGVDVGGQILSVNTWTALKDTVDFTIVRVFNYNNTVDITAGPTIANAYLAGFTDLSLYWIPCVKGSLYARTYNITCTTPKEQLDSVITHLNKFNIKFVEYDRTTDSPSHQPSYSPTLTWTPTFKPTLSPTDRPTIIPSTGPTESPTTATPTKTPTNSPTFVPTTTTYTPSFGPTANPTIGANVWRIYVNVEDSIPRRFFTNNSTKNLEYLLDLETAAWQYGIQLGIYTTLLDWYNIIEDLQTNFTNPFRDDPLWTPQFDGVYSMDFFVPFSGWNAPYIKQVSGGSSEMRRIGSNRISYNYIKDEWQLNYTQSTVVVEPKWLES